jgi:C4-dicarboxylate-specific signal transduction histidine kinase
LVLGASSSHFWPPFRTRAWQDIGYEERESSAGAGIGIRSAIRHVESYRTQYVGTLPRVPSQGKTRRWQSDENLPTVSVDLTQIQQVFINLISNAMEALEGSQLSPHIIVRASATDQNKMLIQVIDNGPGVADQERIFDA